MIMVSNEFIIETLTDQYRSKDMDSRLDKDKLIGLFQQAVKDDYLQLKKVC